MPESQEGLRVLQRRRRRGRRGAAAAALLLLGAAVVVCQVILNKETNEDGDNLITKTGLA